MSERMSLPVLPLKDFVLFPGVTTPINAGRPGTLKAIEAALTTPERLVFAVSQREDVREVSPENLYTIGTVAKCANRLTHPVASTAMYLGLGWISVFILKPLMVALKRWLLDHEESLSTQAREFLTTILKNATRMNRLTEDLLVMARVDSSEQDLHPATVGADILVRDAVQAMSGLVQDAEARLEIGKPRADSPIRRAARPRSPISRGAEARALGSSSSAPCARLRHSPTRRRQS